MQNYEKLQNIFNIYKPERSCLSWLNCCSPTPPEITLEQSQFIDGLKGVANKLFQGEQVSFGDFRRNSYEIVKSKPSETTRLIPDNTDTNRAEDFSASSQSIIVMAMPEEHRDTIFRLFLYAIYNYLNECIAHDSNVRFCNDWKTAFEHGDNFAAFIKDRSSYEGKDNLLSYIDSFASAIRERLPLYKAARTHVEANVERKVGTGTIPLPTQHDGAINSAASPAHISSTFDERPSSALPPPGA